MIRNKRGQSTLEYLLVLAAVVGLLVWAAQGPIRVAVTNMFSDANDTISTAADYLEE
ncbi:MAG: hypothetical protein P9L96_02505 [Candidatus Gygaella obscura]|nr:hypothetical protein [Candidatus Gygaella obscura]